MDKTMDKTRTIDRIRKLMELAANNPSAEEAKSAALAAQRLMAEHDIQEHEVMRTAKEAIAEIRGGKFKGNPWAVHLGTVIADNFRCVAYLIEDTYRPYGSRRCRKKGMTVVFVGRETDAEAARITFDRLFEIGNKLASREARRVREIRGTAIGVRNSFLMGFVAGIRSVLDEQCVALKMVVPAEVAEYAEKVTSGYDAYSGNVRGASNEESYGRGVEAGMDSMRAGRIEA